MIKPRIDMHGKRYGRCIGVAPVRIATSGDVVWSFVCDCGAIFEASGYDLRSGKRQDCPSCAAIRTRDASIVHGMSGTAEFRIWTGMLTRCYNKNAKHYERYGGRGIGVCDEWRDSFKQFFADMGPRPSASHSIDRKDNDGNYEPGNCRWATPEEQASNKRSSVRVTAAGNRSIKDLAEQAGISPSGMWMRVNKGGAHDLLRPSKMLGSIKYLGITDTCKGWSNRTGIKQSTIAMRLNKYGWPIEKALSKGAKPWADS